MFLLHTAEQLFPEKQALKVLDLCAAPGGKSTLLAGWLDREGMLVSNEVIRARAAILEENMIKWGYPNVFVTQEDPAGFEKLPEFFDMIVADAPCSGEGLFRKDPAAADEWTESNCSLCEGRQRRIVEDVLPSLKENGILIYSTCTYNPGENDGNIEWICEQLGMEIVPIAVPAEWNIEKTEAGGYAFYPHRLKGEGFYICCLRRCGENTAENSAPGREKKPRDTWQKIPKEFESEALRLLSDPHSFFFFRHNDDLRAVPAAIKEESARIYRELYVRHGGLTIGTIKGKDLVPSHDLALCTSYSSAYPSVELGKKEALQFLKRESIKISDDIPKGWATVTYHSLPLGWIKNLGNRINNYYPPNWRIRMDIDA